MAKHKNNNNMRSLAKVSAGFNTSDEELNGISGVDAGNRTESVYSIKSNWITEWWVESTVLD